MGKRTVWRCDGRNGECGNRRRSDVINRSRWSHPAEAATFTDQVEPNEFVHYDVNFNKHTCGCGHWKYYGIACKYAVSVWEKYQEQLEEMNGARMEADEYLEARARFAVGNQPIYIFLHKYSLKLQMISKQIVSSYHVNRLTCLTSISIHRSRFLRNRFENAPAATTRCGICGQLGHNQLTCEYYEVWFDSNDPNDVVFRNIFSHALNPNGNRARLPH